MGTPSPTRLKIGWFFGLASVVAFFVAGVALAFNLPEVGKGAIWALVACQFMAILTIPESILFWDNLFSRKDK